MTPTPQQISHAIVERMVRRHCDSCDQLEHTLFEHKETAPMGTVTWRFCARCESRRIAEAEAERKLVDSLGADLEMLLGRWHKMDRDEACAALQGLRDRLVAA